MYRSSRYILPIIGLLLLLIAILEVYFYLVYNPPQTASLQNSLFSTLSHEGNPSSISDSSRVILDLNSLSSYNKNGVSKAILNLTYGGKIIAIERTPGALDYFPYKYNVIITVNTKNNNINNIYFLKEEIEKTTVIDKRNGQENPISFTDLKVGDNIIINQEVNLLLNYGQNLIKSEIDLINQ